MKLDKLWFLADVSVASSTSLSSKQPHPNDLKGDSNRVVNFQGQLRFIDGWVHMITANLGEAFLLI